MSLLTQKSKFTTDRRSVTLESDPNTMAEVEEKAMELGAVKDGVNHHYFHFSGEDAENNLKAVEAKFLSF